MRKVKSIFLISAIVLSLFACNKSEIELSNTTEDASLLKIAENDRHNWAIINDYSSMNEFLEDFIHKDEDYKTNFLKQTFQIYSLANIHEVGMEHINESEYDEFNALKEKYPFAFDEINFDSSVLYELPVAFTIACMINSDGVVQIGDTIFKYTIDGFYKINERYGSDLESAIKSGKYSFTEVEPIKNQFSYKTDYDPTNSLRRIVARLYCTPVGIWYEYDARTTSQSSAGWLSPWVQNRISEIGLSYPEGVIFSKNGMGITLVPGYSRTETNAADLRKNAIVIIADHSAVDMELSSVKIRHWGIRHGNTMEIENNELLRP